MKLTQIRNATMIIEYFGKKFLIDPYLAEKETYSGFEGTMNSHLRNPRVNLPFTLNEILNVDAVILTHIHPDHFDEVAIKVIPKNIKIFVQNKEERDILSKLGFTNLDILSYNGNVFSDITLIKTDGQHGLKEKVSEIYKQANLSPEACGVIFKNKNEKTLYLAGDTVWCMEVENTLQKYNPEIIVLNAGDARLLNGISIIMGKHDVVKTAKMMPKSMIIATHLEAVNHAILSRQELEDFLQKNDIKNVLVAYDGENYIF